ncbi:hypothetical protein, partial [Thalassospira lucentensis]|uniref:hypothetical protein n=1 Tax=Thalassospira lucentensis TaxID=168935 RepID=UPI0023F090A7
PEHNKNKLFLHAVLKHFSQKTADWVFLPEYRHAQDLQAPSGLGTVQVTATFCPIIRARPACCPVNNISTQRCFDASAFGT